MDGFTYEQAAGGWSVCDICGVRVSDEAKHTGWHRALRLALLNARDGTLRDNTWNEPPMRGAQITYAEIDGIPICIVNGTFCEREADHDGPHGFNPNPEETPDDRD